MDDGRLANEMTLEGIATQLKELKDTVSEVKASVSEVKASVSEVKASVSEVKASVSEVKASVSELRADVTELRGDVTELKVSVATLDQRMTAGFTRVDEQLNASKMRDEELHGLIKFSLEANDALRESMETRFTVVDKKQDEEIGLVNDVIRDLPRR